jgi:hypothetical protein
MKIAYLSKNVLYSLLLLALYEIVQLLVVLPQNVCKRRGLARTSDPFK